MYKSAKNFLLDYLAPHPLLSIPKTCNWLVAPLKFVIVYRLGMKKYYLTILARKGILEKLIDLSYTINRDLLNRNLTLLLVIYKLSSTLDQSKRVTSPFWSFPVETNGKIIFLNFESRNLVKA